MSPPPWAAALTSRRGLIPSEPSASAERGTGRLSAAQLAGLVWSLTDSHRVVRTRLVLGFGGWLMGPTLRPEPTGLFRTDLPLCDTSFCIVAMACLPMVLTAKNALQGIHFQLQGF